MLPIWFVTSFAMGGPRQPAFEWVPVSMERPAGELCFPSGLRVNIVQDDSAPVVSVTAIVSSGVAGDAPDRAGAAELLNNLWYRSHPFGKASVRDHFQAEGARFNGFTLMDATAYVAVVPRAGLPQILRLYGALVTDPLVGIGPTELASEQDIIFNARHGIPLAAWNAVPLLPDDFFPAGHAYRSLAPVTSETLHAVTLRDLRAIASRAYRPDLVSLQILGDITMEEAGREIQAAFPEAALWNGPDGQPSTKTTCDAPGIDERDDPAPAAPTEPILQVEADVDRPALIVAWRLPASYRAEDALRQLAMADLEEAIRWDLIPSDQLDLECSTVVGVQASVALCVIQLENGESARKWKHRVTGSLDEMRAEADWDPDWRLQRLKIDLWARIVDSMELSAAIDADDHALGWALTHHFTGDTGYHSTATDSVAQVTSRGLERFEKAWLDRKGAWAIHVLPRDSAHVDEETGEGDVAISPGFAHGGVATRSTGMTRGGSIQSSTDLDVLASLQTRDPGSLALPIRDAEVVRLENGLTVVIVPYGKVPLVRTALVFGGGGSADEPSPGAQALRPWLVYQEDGRLHEGHVLTADRIAGEWEEWASVQSRSTVLRASSGNLDGALYLLRSYTEQTIVSSDSRWRQIVRDYLSQDVDLLSLRVEPWERSLRLVPLLGERSLAWSEAERAWTGFARTGTAELLQWERATARPETATLYIVGRVEPSKAESLVHFYFDSWHAGGEPWEAPEAVPLPAPPERTVHVMDDTFEDEAVVTASCRAEPGTRASREVAAGTLDWLAWQALRLAPDLAAYNPNAWVETDERSFAVYTIRVNVRADQAGRAVQSVLGVLHDASASPDPRLVSLVRNQLRLWEPMRWLSTDSILEELIARGAPKSDLTDVDAHFAGLADADPRTALTGCVGHEVITLRGPAAAIEASLQESQPPSSRADVAAYVHAVRQRNVH